MSVLCDNMMNEHMAGIPSPQAGKALFSAHYKKIPDCRLITLYLFVLLALLWQNNDTLKMTSFVGLETSLCSFLVILSWWVMIGCLGTVNASPGSKTAFSLQVTGSAWFSAPAARIYCSQPHRRAWCCCYSLSFTLWPLLVVVVFDFASGWWSSLPCLVLLLHACIVPPAVRGFRAVLHDISSLRLPSL